MRRIWIVVAVIVVIGIVIIAAFGYQAYAQRNALRDIQVSVDRVRVDSVSLTSATLNITFRFTNPTTTTATLDRTDFTILINGNLLGSGQNLQKVQIPAGGSTTVPIPFTVSYTGAAQSAWSFLTQGGANYTITGTAFFDNVFGTVSVPYTFSGTTTR